MGRLALIVIALVGCRQVFGIGDPVLSDGRSSTDGAVDPNACSRMSMLADDFAGNDLDVLWPASTATAGTITETGGALKFDMTDKGIAVLSSYRFYDIREGSFSLGLTETGMLMNTDTWSLMLTSQRARYGVQIDRSGNNLLFSRVDDGNTVTIGTIPYNASADRYLRIAQNGSTTTFDTSPDGITYTTQTLFTGLDYMTFMTVTFLVFRNGTNNFAVTLDHVNGGTPSGQACAIGQLTDTFSGTTLDDKWGRSGASNGTLAEHGGILELAFTPGGTSTSVYLSPSALYDLRNGAFVVEIPKMIQSSTTESFDMVATTATGSEMAFGVSGGVLRAQKTGGIVITEIAFDPAGSRWLRFRSAGAMTYWDRSADGVSWQNLGQANDLTGLDRVDLVIEVSGSTGTPDSAELDNIGLPPP